MQKPLVSVIIPAFNEEKHIGACLECLTKQTTAIPYEIIVVNNASTDRTAEAALKYSVRVIDEKRKGRGSARQTGFLSAQAEIILGTEADTIVPADWINNMYTCLQRPGWLAVTGPMRIQELSTIKRWIVNVCQPLTMRVYHLLYGYPLFCGFNMGIHKELLLKAGGFNTSLNTLDDVDLGKRVSKFTKIHIVYNLPVIVSARRFKDSFWRGFFDYIKANFDYQRQRLPVFSDPR